MKNFFTLLAAALFTITGFAQGNMAFQAKIENKNGDVIYIKDNATIVQEIKINPKGIFQAQFPIKDGFYQLFDGVEYAELYLKNGYDLNMTMDASKFDETIKFTGKGSKENNYLADETRTEEAFGYDKMFGMNETDFAKALDGKKKSDLDKLNKAALDADFTSKHKAGIEQNLLGIQQYYTMAQAKKKMNNAMAPNFDYENAAGGKTTLESLKGKYVYVDIWATWCGPCRAEIPSLKKMEAAYHDKNIEFVSVSVDSDKDHDKWKTFVAEKELSGIQLYAGKTVVPSEFIKAFEVNTIPRFILIDPTGKIVDADAARPSDPRLKEKFDSIVK